MKFSRLQIGQAIFFIISLLLLYYKLFVPEYEVGTCYRGINDRTVIYKITNIKYDRYYLTQFLGNHWGNDTSMWIFNMHGNYWQIKCPPASS